MQKPPPPFFCLVHVGSVIDVGSEWRSFGNSDKSKDSKDRSRVGLEENPLLDGDQGLAIAPIPNKPHGPFALLSLAS